MNRESATATYTVPQPFDATVRTLRRALADAGLKITMELDVSERIRERLLIGMAPCLILFASAMDPDITCAGGLAPLHVVISGCGEDSEIHILRVPRDEGSRSPAGTDLLVHLQSKIATAIEKIGMRVPLGA